MIEAMQTLSSSKSRRQRGFTLIELMVVVAVIAILAAVALVPGLILMRQEPAETI